MNKSRLKYLINNGTRKELEFELKSVVEKEVELLNNRKAKVVGVQRRFEDLIITLEENGTYTDYMVGEFTLIFERVV